MHRVLKRIAVNGLITALILGGIGLLYAELAGLWLTGSGNRVSPQTDTEIQSAIRQRVPLRMAMWGFVFIAVAEVGLYLWRGEPPVKDAKAAKGAPRPDEAELLLEELLKQAEAKRAQEQATEAKAQGPEEGGAGSAAQKGSPNGGGAGMLTPNP
jgi:hypothetical protein